MSRKNRPSQKRIEANRRNAQKSTGPRTEEGKARSAQNAITHGLSNPVTKAQFLNSEDEQQFQILLGEYAQTYQPQHRDESDLLKEAVYAKWRQERFWTAETAQLQVAIARNEVSFQKELPRADAAAHLANAVAESADLLKLYMRYGQQLHRQYRNSLKELRDLQRERLPNPDQPSEPTEQTNTAREQGDPKIAEASDEAPNQATEPNQPTVAPEPSEATEPDQPAIIEPSEATLTPEQARLAFMKAEIKRFEDYQARVIAQMNNQTME